jgi:hypothetical protein
MEDEGGCSESLLVFAARFTLFDYFSTRALLSHRPLHFFLRPELSSSSLLFPKLDCDFKKTYLSMLKRCSRYFGFGEHTHN